MMAEKLSSSRYVSHVLFLLFTVAYMQNMNKFNWMIFRFDPQVWAVNSAGRSPSAWANGKTGPAPPEGIGPPIFLRVSATAAVVDIHPPARPNGIVSLYRVFSIHHNNRTLVWKHNTASNN